MSKRVYVLEYAIQVNLYSENGPKFEQRVEYFSREERDKFIQRYLDLKDKYYIENLKSYYSELQEVDVDEMIKAI